MKLSCERGAKKEYTDPSSGQQYWSCSQVLKVLDPDLYTGIHWETLENARQRGTDMHRIFFYWMAALQGQQNGKYICDVPARPEHYGGYYDSIGKFIAKHKPSAVLLEESSIIEKWGVAGTADGLLWLDWPSLAPRGRVRRLLTLVDLKTGSHEVVHDVQVHCYHEMPEFKKATRMATLYIWPDGFELYHVHNNPLHLAAFQNGVNILRWRQAV